MGKAYNCQSFTHELYGKAGYKLPESMLSQEISLDEKHFRRVEIDVEPIEELDIFLFGKPDLNDPKKLHLAVYLGKNDETNDPLLAHATAFNKEGTTIWPLRKFLQTKNYRTLYSIKRLTDEGKNSFAK